MIQQDTVAKDTTNEAILEDDYVKLHNYRNQKIISKDIRNLKIEINSLKIDINNLKNKIERITKIHA